MKDYTLPPPTSEFGDYVPPPTKYDQVLPPPAMKDIIPPGPLLEDYTPPISGDFAPPLTLMVFTDYIPPGPYFDTAPPIGYEFVPPGGEGPQLKEQWPPYIKDFLMADLVTSIQHDIVPPITRKSDYQPPISGNDVPPTPSKGDISPSVMEVAPPIMGNDIVSPTPSETDLTPPISEYEALSNPVVGPTPAKARDLVPPTPSIPSGPHLEREAFRKVHPLPHKQKHPIDSGAF